MSSPVDMNGLFGQASVLIIVLVVIFRLNKSNTLEFIKTIFAEMKGLFSAKFSEAGTINIVTIIISSTIVAGYFLFDKISSAINIFSSASGQATTPKSGGLMFSCVLLIVVMGALSTWVVKSGSNKK